MPLNIVEDYCNNDRELLALCIGQLVRAGDLASATTLYQRHQPCLDNILDTVVLSKVQNVQQALTLELDVFAPANYNALALPFWEGDVAWIDTAKNALVAEDIVRSESVIGIDFEWSSIGDWLEPSMALMQIATPDQVFLVDMACPGLQGSVASLLQCVLCSEQPLVAGFAFHNDIRELKRSPWSNVCKKIKGVCDLQLLSGRPREGLACLVERLLHKPLCKVEQRSYWHRRPLRAAQRHYAALDAYVLLLAGSALVGTPLSDPERLASKLKVRSMGDAGAENSP